MMKLHVCFVVCLYLILLQGCNYPSTEQKRYQFGAARATMQYQRFPGGLFRNKSTLKMFPDSVSISDMKRSDVVKSLLNRAQGFKYIFGSQGPLVSLTISGGSAAERQELLCQMFQLSFDTLPEKREPFYEIEYRPDSSQLVASLFARQIISPKPGYFAGTIKDLAFRLSTDFNVSIVSRDTQFVFINAGNLSDFETYSGKLQSQYGIYFKLRGRMPLRTIRVEIGN